MIGLLFEFCVLVVLILGCCCLRSGCWNVLLLVGGFGGFGYCRLLGFGFGFGCVWG